MSLRTLSIEEVGVGSIWLFGGSSISTQNTYRYVVNSVNSSRVLFSRVDSRDNYTYTHQDFLKHFFKIDTPDKEYLIRVQTLLSQIKFFDVSLTEIHKTLVALEI